jgi:(p)ppGpp synthase/HD superfamily hydrolase
MQTERARLLAERLHANDYEEDGTALLEHVRRVARRVEVDVQVAAWLHEVLEWTAIAEHELLREGLDSDELRALRLMYGAHGARSDGVLATRVANH